MHRIKQDSRGGIDMETGTTNTTSIFLHESSEIEEAFTELWMQFINDKERSQSIILQNNVSGL